MYDGNNHAVSKEHVTKTRSRKYFDINSNTQRVKTDEEVLLEFSDNKSNFMEEAMKDKPAPHPETPTEGEAEILTEYQKILRAHGINTKIINGKIVSA